MHPPQLVAVIDAGGTACKVTLASKGGIAAQAVSGPCNYATLGLEKTLQRLKDTTELAIAKLPASMVPPSQASPTSATLSDTSALPSTVVLPTPEALFAAVTIGMSGVDRTSDVESLTPHIERLFTLMDPTSIDDTRSNGEAERRLLIGNDAVLLSVPMMGDEKVKRGIAVIAGTGSVAFSFTKDSTDLPVPLRRAGGYGFLLGDGGSGYHVGKMSLESVLQAFDAGKTLSPYHHHVLDLAQCRDDPASLLQYVYEDKSDRLPGSTPVARIASLCKGTLEWTYKEGDGESRRIVQAAVTALGDLVQSLMDEEHEGAPEEGGEHSQTMLVLGGGLFRNAAFKEDFLGHVKQRGLIFNKVTVVEDAGERAALVLADTLL